MPEKGSVKIEPGPLPGLFSATEHFRGSENVKEVEEHPHITLLYGITEPLAPPDAPAWWKLSLLFGRVKRKLPRSVGIDKKPSVFRNDQFDVVKFDVDREPLQPVHDHIRQNFDTDVEFDFHPHVTVAYLEPGTAPDTIGEHLGVDWVDVVGLSYNGPECRERITKTLAEI